MVRIGRTRGPGAGGFSLIETLFTIGLMALVASIATPTIRNEVGYLRISGDARGLSNVASLAKMRAAATFTQGRLYADLASQSYRVETWQQSGTPAWVSSGGTRYLTQGDTFGLGAASGPPPNTQVTIAQAPACRDAAGNAIANTACIVFTSRGSPIVASGAPTGTEGPTALDALYLTDGRMVYGLTVSAAGAMQLWGTNSAIVTAWTVQ